MQKKNSKALREQFRAKCKAHHLSMTPQRSAIYMLLLDSDQHPSTQEIFDRVKELFPDISLDTVYRTLTTFAEIGVIQVVEGYGEAKRYDPNVEPHHHFRCRKCRQIIDFHEKRFDDLKPPKSITDTHSVVSVKVILEGICNNCRKK